MKLIFATANENKVREIAQMLKEQVELLGLKDINCLEDIPETTPTIEGNAIQKAQYVYDNYGVNCFAEDTGLEVQTLEMRPGVLTARYAGEHKDPQANMDKVLAELDNQSNRKARFKTVISYIDNGAMFTFEGIVNGRISKVKRGGNGFGYDPIFIPENEDRTFAEMSDSEKNNNSHRGRALTKFLEFLSRR